MRVGLDDRLPGWCHECRMVEICVCDGSKGVRRGAF